MTYEEFLKTDIWKATAESVFRRAGGMCERCGCTTGPFHAHHITYICRNRDDAPRWVPQGWLPQYWWLMCLDSDCHRYIHNLGDVTKFVETKKILMNRHPSQRHRLIVIEVPWDEYGPNGDWIAATARAV